MTWIKSQLGPAVTELKKKSEVDDAKIWCFEFEIYRSLTLLQFMNLYCRQNLTLKYPKSQCITALSIKLSINDLVIGED